MATNAQGAAQSNVTNESSSQATQGSQGAGQEQPQMSNKVQGYTGVVLLTSAITVLMYLQIVGTYKLFHKRHPRIFRKPKLPPFEVMRERVRNSKVVNKLKELGSQLRKDEGKPAANSSANDSGQVNQGFMDEDYQEPNNTDEDNQQRSVSSRASTTPRLRTARRANWADRVRRVNRQMRANDAE